MNIEVNILHCGQGDTILLGLFGLPDTRWVLIDCNLVGEDARRSFFEFVNEKGVKRLDLVCLTHSHEDHYTGMEDVVRHFTTEGRSLGYFCDCGFDANEVRTLLRRRNRPKSSVVAFEKLYNLIYQLLEDKLIKYKRVDQDSVSLIKFGNPPAIQLLPVGPDSSRAKLVLKDTVNAGEIKGDLNALSMVLALVARSPDQSLDFILAADTDAAGMTSAITQLQEKTALTTLPRFNAVKVSHHGSLDSHKGSPICKLRHTDRESVALVSAGHFDVLPDQYVLKDFIQNNWTVLLTTKRIPNTISFTFQLSGQPRVQTTHQSRNIKVVWQSMSGLSWEPPESRVGLEDLGFYQTAVTATKKTKKTKKKTK